MAILPYPNLDSKPNLASLDLSVQSPKDRPWSIHKGRAEELQSFLFFSEYSPSNFDAKRWASRMVECAHALEFRVTESETGKVFRLHRAEFCRVPICPVCQWRRSMKWRARLICGFDKLIQAFPNHQYIFLTLTVRNCPVECLRAEIKRMVQAWHSLCHRKEFPAVGYVRSLEVTRSQTGECHPHFHCLLMVSKGYFTGKYYLSQERWTELWRQCLKVDYTPIVNVKKVKDRRKRKKRAKQLDLEGQGKVNTTELDNGILAAILETAKYCVKPDDLLADPNWIVKVADQIFRLQKTVTGGLIRRFINDREDDDDLIHITEDQGGEILTEHDYYLIFDWWSVFQRYLKRIED